MALERMSPEVLELFGINPETEYYVRDNRMRLDNDFLGALIKRKIPAREVAGLLGDNPYSSRFETALDILRQAAAKSSLGNSNDFDIPFVDNELSLGSRIMAILMSLLLVNILVGPYQKMDPIEYSTSMTEPSASHPIIFSVENGTHARRILYSR